MRYFSLVLASLSMAVVILSCGRSSVTTQGSKLQASDNSTYLVESGERAKTYVYELIQKNELVVVDARDPRLYPNGGPFQPPVPADKAIVAQYPNGRFRVIAYIIDQPGYFEIKAAPTGNFVVSIGYGVEALLYTSRFDGLYASVSRNTSGYGWNYLYYIRFRGNAVSPAGFDVAVGNFLTNSIRFVANLR